VAEELVPVFRVADADEALGWYQRLGFVEVGRHRFGEGYPWYVFVQRGDLHLHLSEHTGDAPHRSLAYLYADDLDAVAAEFGVAIEEQEWGRDLELTDPDGNRIRVGEAKGAG
jgi:catechol 2,3-dioxygenase-like lactoylglutathione lyase family enzyme